MTNITAIVAMDNKQGIATSVGIPWNVPQDKRYFRRKTINKTVIMGRKTYQSIAGPLINRNNIVLSHSIKNITGCQIVQTMDESLKVASGDIMVIGGQEVYMLFLPIADKLLITHVEGDFLCTKFFPNFRDRYHRVYKSKKYSSRGLIFWYEHWKRSS